MTAFFYITMTIFIIVCLILVLLILIQKGRGGGLASAFGGGGGGNTAFGAKTGDVLTWATSVIFGIFLVLAILLNMFAQNIHEGRTRPGAAAPPPPPVRTIPVDPTAAPGPPPGAQTPQQATPVPDPGGAPLAAPDAAKQNQP